LDSTFPNPPMRLSRPDSEASRRMPASDRSPPVAAPG
jgi:hypothetical protein